MMLGKLPVPGRPTNLQRPTALAVGAGGVVWTFFPSFVFFPFSERRPI